MHQQGHALAHIPCNPGISLGSQGVKLCPPTGCAGVLYHLQGVFEPVYNRFSTALSTTTTCPNDQLLQNSRYPRSLWPAPAGCLSGWKAISGIPETNWQVPQDAPNRTTTPSQGLRWPCGTPVGDPTAAGRRGMTGHGRARGQIGVYMPRA